MYPISLDQDIARKLDQGMRSGDNVELPFPVVYVWALNGQASYKSQGGALYYGGWACKEEDLRTMTEQAGLAIPKDWKQVTISSRDGGEFEAFTARNLVVAPIGKRESWLHDGKRSAGYVDGSRRHLQVLAYLAEAHGENGSRTLIPWGPVVLTAKGYQALNIMDAFNRWHRATMQIRRKIAPGIPAWCFYLSLGTYGKERQVTNVGKPGAQSPITPITAYIPERFTEEMFTNLFVGQEIASLMADLQDQAHEWLNAWTANSLAEANVDVYPEPGFGPEEEEIPF